MELACYGLCGHLYKCNRLDISNICKYIHKVHSLLSRNVTVDVSNKEEPLEDDYHFNYTNTTKNGQVQEIAKLKKTELDVFHENINRLTKLVNIPVVKSLRLGNINRQLVDLISQCEAVKKISDDDIGEKQAMGNTNQCHIHPNGKLETQIKPGKFQRTKKAQNKRTVIPLSITLFKNKEEFIKRITANEPMKKPELQSSPCKKQLLSTVCFQSDKSTKKQVLKKRCVLETNFISKESEGYISRIKDLKDYKVSLIKFGCIDITYLSILSLEVIFTSNKYENIRKIDKGFKPGWLQDEVIAAYFYCLRQRYKNFFH